MEEDKGGSDKLAWFVLGIVLAVLYFSINKRLEDNENAIQKLKAKTIHVRTSPPDSEAMGEGIPEA